MSSRQTSVSLRRLIPVFVFAAFAIGLIIVLLLTGRDPAILSVEPAVVRPGERLEISGRYFGSDPGTVLISGQQIPSSSVITWNDSTIVIVVPDSTISGLMFVKTDGGTSEGTLVQMWDSVARSAGVSDRPGAPHIDMLEQPQARIGDLLTIHGTNFGSTRRDARVVFPGQTDDRTVEPEPASVSYPLWTNDTILVRVPSGAVGGFLLVDTPWGTSNPMRLQIERPAGQLVRTDETEIAIDLDTSILGVNVKDESGSAGSRDMVVWLPGVPSGFEQSNVRFIQGVDAEQVDVAGGPVFRARYEDVSDAFTASLGVGVVAKRYGIGIDVDTSRLSPVYEGQSGFFEHFTRSTPEFPGDDSRFTAPAAEIRRGRANPYLIGNAAYDWVLQHMTYAIGETDRSAIAGFDRGTGDDYTYAALLVTVLRAAQIPARMVSGVVISGTRDAYTHHWAEFFVPSIGWIPADPAFGDGAFPAAFPEPDDPAGFYFAGLDSRRITLSYGIILNGPEHRDGTNVVPGDPYAAMTTYVEGGPGIMSIDAVWDRPRVLLVGTRPPEEVY